MSTEKQPQEWMEKIERFGEAVAASLEKAGDRFAKALESLDDFGDSRTRGKHRVHVDDQRGKAHIAVETLDPGDTFELSGHLYLRIDSTTDGEAPTVDAVRLTTGSVRRVERGTEVRRVSVKVVLDDEPAEEPKADEPASPPPADA